MSSWFLPVRVCALLGCGPLKGSLFPLVLFYRVWLKPFLLGLVAPLVFHTSTFRVQGSKVVFRGVDPQVLLNLEQRTCERSKVDVLFVTLI